MVDVQIQSLAYYIVLLIFCHVLQIKLNGFHDDKLFLDYLFDELYENNQMCQ